MTSFTAIIRFSGHEIYHNPFGAARELYDYINESWFRGDPTLPIGMEIDPRDLEDHPDEPNDA